MYIIIKQKTTLNKKLNNYWGINNIYMCYNYQNTLLLCEKLKHD